MNNGEFAIAEGVIGTWSNGMDPNQLDYTSWRKKICWQLPAQDKEINRIVCEAGDNLRGENGKRRD